MPLIPVTLSRQKQVSLLNSGPALSILLTSRPVMTVAGCKVNTGNQRHFCMWTMNNQTVEHQEEWDPGTAIEMMGHIHDDGLLSSYGPQSAFVGNDALHWGCMSSVFSVAVTGSGIVCLYQADLTLDWTGPLKVALPAQEAERRDGKSEEDRQHHESCRQITFAWDAGAWEKNLFAACSGVIFNAPTEWAGDSRDHITNPPIEAKWPVPGTTGLLVICWHLNF